MLHRLLLISAAAASIAVTASAQSPRMDPTASASAMTGTMSADDVGVQPITGASTADFVSQTAASDLFEIQSGRVADGKAKNKEIRAFASTMIRDHEKAMGVLKGALDNAQRKLAPPSDQLPTDKQAMLDQLNHTPRGAAFDSLYLTQQLQAHQQAWALQKGYATGGDDPALRNVAAGTVPVVENHLTMIKALQTTAQ